MTPSESAAAGCSPTERSRRPNGVRNTTNHVIGTRMNARYTRGLNDNWSMPNSCHDGRRLRMGVLVAVLLYRPDSTTAGMPMAIRLMAVPLMIWSARYLMDTTAWIQPTKPPTTRPARTPSHGAYATTAAGLFAT